MITRRFPVARLLAAMVLSGAALCASAAPAPGAAQFLEILQKQAASEAYDQYAVTGLYTDEHGRQFAAAILTKLSEQQAYRDDLEQWLAEAAAEGLAGHPPFTLEDLVSNWLRRYQQIRLASFAFLDKQDVALLYRLPRLHPLYGTERAGCGTRSQKETYALVHRTRHALIDEHKERLASAIAAAYVRELGRIRKPVPGERPVEQAETARVMAALKNLAASLPPEDAAIVANDHARDKRAPRTPQQECDNVWASSHAILDSTLGDADFLRQSVSRAAYAVSFSQQAPLSAPRQARPDFTPGKAFVYLPLLLEKRKVSGLVNVTVNVDERGSVSSVATAWHSLSPAYVTSANGEHFAAIDLMLPVFDKYYRDGKFTPRIVDGKAVPFSFSHEVEWK